MINLLISDILLLTNLAFFYSKLFKPKRSKLFLYTSFLLNIIIYIILNLYVEVSIKIICIIMLIILFGILNYSDRLIKQIVTSFTLITIVLLVEVFFASLFQLFSEIDSFIKVNSISFLVAVFLANAFIFVLIIYFTKFLKHDSVREMPLYTWTLLVLPISTIAFILNIRDFILIMKEDNFILFILLGLALSNVILIYIFFKVIDFLKYKNKLDTVQLEDEFIKSRYELLQKQYDQSFSFLHDILKKSIELQNLLKSENYNALQDELDLLTNKSFREFNMLYTNSKILNNLINSKLSLLNKLHIEVRCTLEYHDFSFMKTVDQLELFSSLLDFTISACSTSTKDKKVIIIRSKIVNESIQIQFLYNKSGIYDDYIYDTLLNYLEKIKKEYSLLYSFDTVSFEESDSILLLFFM